MVAGLRLRRDLRRFPAPSAESGSEAVLDPNGRVQHAQERAEPQSARDSLREAVRSRERARGSLRRKDADTALGIWRALVVGRWSLVDHFESDGRRYIVAVPNAPRSRDPRGLTDREQAVAELLALGQSNKRIAYALGVSEGTVAALAHRTLRKLGLRSRAALAELLSTGQRATAAIPVSGGTKPPVALVAPEARPRASLTPRQREIVTRLGHGATNVEIARALGCSPNTIANTLRALFHKAGVGSRAELVRWVREGAGSA
jgi:DNA-binding NarL/FixJ family response regulator